MVLIDPINKNTQYCHMAASTIEELHSFAKLIGINKCWFSNKKGRYQPHYDLVEYERKLALEKGAKAVGRGELFVFLKQNFKPQTTI